MKKEHFCEKIKETQERRAEENKKLMRLGVWRVITFFSMSFGVIWGVQGENIAGWLLAAVMLAAFIELVRRYHRLQQAIEYDKAMEAVLNRYVCRLVDDQRGWKGFVENGSQYLKETDTKSKDLDLIGRSSLYQYLSVCHTPYGKRKLAKALSQGCASREEILRRQEAVKELIEDEEFALHLQALSWQMAERDEKIEEDSRLESFITEAEQKRSYVSTVMRLLSYGLPFATLFAIISILNRIYITPAYVIAALGIVSQLSIAFLSYSGNEEILGPVYTFIKKVETYKAFLSALETKQFESPYLKALQAQLLQSGSAVKGLKALNTLSAAIDVRYNGILYLAAAGLLMWDTHCKDVLEKWSQRYGQDVRMWLEVAGSFEELLSLAVMGQVRENYCFPEIEESNEPVISFSHLLHPLIPEERAVGNSFSLKSETCIVTGSNMSGKTTFLRSIGTGLSLAYAGGVVPAEHFSASYMKYFTSMRVEDRVDMGISTFYAELLRIKEMVQYSKEGKPMLVLIDEIFKGTNSLDRILGAEETIKRLSRPWVNVLVSTHDFELCSLKGEGGRKMVNCHFEEYYKDDKILFDYRLKQGRSQTTNARFLLKMAGIID